MRFKHKVRILGVLIVLAVAARAQSTAKNGSSVGVHHHNAGMTIGSEPARLDLQQTGSGRRVAVPIASLPVVVDGARTPHLVPDWLAYYHFIMAVSVASNAPVDEVARRESLLNAIAFERSDHDRLVEALMNVREQLDQVALDRKQWASAVTTPSAVAALKGLKVREKQILDAAHSSLVSALSPDGQQRLNIHITRHVKAHIKIRGSL